jgi:hypothetical protein
VHSISAAFKKEGRGKVVQLLDIIALSVSFLKRYACCYILCVRADLSISRKRKKGAVRTMKKSFAILIGSLLLSLTLSQSGFADARGSADSNDHAFLQQYETTPMLPAPLLADNKESTFIHLPFARAKHIAASYELAEYFPFIGALLTAKEVLWTELMNWNPLPTFGKIQVFKPIKHGIHKPFDTGYPTSQDHMGISLNHELDRRKAWNLSLDLGVAFQNNQISQDYSISDAPFPNLGMDACDGSADLFDHLRSAAPFVGLGISCTF